MDDPEASTPVDTVVEIVADGERLPVVVDELLSVVETTTRTDD